MQTFELSDLALLYDGDVNFKSKANFSFYLYSDYWTLDLKENLNLSWTNDGKISIKLFVMIRRLLAYRAKNRSFATVKLNNATLKAYGASLENGLKFQAIFNQRSDSNQLNDAKLFKALAKSREEEGVALKNYFSEIISFIDKLEFDSSTISKNVMDPQKGSYSEVEYASIKEKLRNKTISAVNNVKANQSSLFHFMILSTVISVQLMITLLRRPSQLSQLKWCDILPIGISFRDHRYKDLSDVPEVEQLFGDLEQLQIRTFRGKDGEFRRYVEHQSHRIEPDLTSIIMLYRESYKSLLKKSFLHQGLALSDNEVDVILHRSPLFPLQEYFTFNFESKNILFAAISTKSKAMHRSGANLICSIRAITAKLSFESDRFSELTLTNNRLRHTVMTEGALDGWTELQLSKITGVTVKAVRPYIDLNFNARVLINVAFAKNKVIKKFSSQGSKALLKEYQFRVVNEFDEELGAINSKASCVTCESKLGMPIGCYPCDNFRPHADANHKEMLSKAERKLNINGLNSSEGAMKSLKKSIVYIKATIEICNDLKLKSKGVSDES
ncbi:hypothetical protein [Marinomonas sp. PE14-40]|uniref:hypothetical protein n=1 Tax=Marinomonas sp. PE14-40 TaxID=3060621 RepID=UPI003F6791ED